MDNNILVKKLVDYIEIHIEEDFDNVVFVLYYVRVVVNVWR